MGDAVHRKKIIHKCSKQDFISITFTRYSSSNTKGSQELIPNFSLRRFNMVQISNDCTWRNLKPFTVLYSVIAYQIRAANHLFLSQEILQLVLSNNPDLLINLSQREGNWNLFVHKGHRERLVASGIVKNKTYLVMYWNSSLIS